MIFTASAQEYADPVIDWLDAGRGILGRRLFREVGHLNDRRYHRKNLFSYSLALNYQVARIRRICRW